MGLALLWAGEAAFAQAPSPRLPAPTVQGPAPTSAPAPPAEGYSYEAGGRRDPFVSLIRSGAESRVTSRRGEGPAGLAVGDISVRGVVQSRGAMLAMIQGPDNKSYIVRQGDRLLDGSVKSITSRGLVISQTIADPLSTARHRDVLKPLRSLEARKE
jgi:hypothetical protein